MSKNGNRIVFMGIIALYAINVWLTFKPGRDMSTASVVGLVLSFVAALFFVRKTRKILQDNQSLLFPLNLWVPCFIAFALLACIYVQKHAHFGGDIDPIAFLEKKTDYRGGYLLLTDKITYRERVISDDNFLPNVFSKHQILDGVPAITQVRDYRVSVQMPANRRNTRVTVSLFNAVVHLPLNEKKLRNFFADHGRMKGFVTDPEYLIASKLQRVADPIFRSMTYAPANGYFEITLNTTEGILGDLENYGFRIVRKPNSNPGLLFTIQDLDTNTKQQVLPQHTYKASDIPKIFRVNNK